MNDLTLNKIVNQVQRSNLNKKIIPMVIAGLHLYWEKRTHALAKSKATPGKKAKAEKKEVKVKEPVAVKKAVAKKTAKKKTAKKKVAKKDLLK